MIDALTGTVTAQFRTDKHGGRLDVYGKADGNSRAQIRVDSNGAGHVSVANFLGENQDTSAELKVNEYGGTLNIFGKVDNESRVVIGINEYGNAVVSTWDKNGYRQ